MSQKKSKKNILLISPISDNEALWITGDEGLEVKNNILPLGLATIAGLTPDKFNVTIWDELVHGLIDDNTVFTKNYDLVGITGYKSHLPRCRQLAKIFRKRSILVSIGGPGVSGKPEDYCNDFDILFIGEAERTWPQFLREWQDNHYKSEYRQIEKIDLSVSPRPNWESIALDIPKYSMGSVQTTRGCPFDCEFCDVIYLFGRRPRHKPIENVLEEVKVLELLGVRSIFFSDDEFLGDRQYAKDLLKALVTLNRSFSQQLTFSTQLTMNVSRDEEILELLAEANFYLLFIGIETPNQESLKEANKLQNIRGDLVVEIHKILSYGLAVRAGIIVGFDHDTTDIFDMQYEFIQKAFLPSVGINMLKAPSGTRLWTRLRQEGRVVSIPALVKGKLGHPRSYTNIIPKLMTRLELMQGYRKLLTEVYSWESFIKRIMGFVGIIRRKPQVFYSCENRKEENIPYAELKINHEERESLEKVIKYTAQNTPYLTKRVKALIVQHAKYRESISLLLPQIDRQVKLESLGELTFERDLRPIPVTSEFKKAYKIIFPDLYRRIYSNVRDKNEVPAALVEIMIDFLVRYGTDFQQLQDYHRLFLNEICDRTCAKFNGQVPEDFVSIIDNDTTMPSTKHFRLDDDILKSTEQILIKLASGQTDSQSYD